MVDLVREKINGWTLRLRISAGASPSSPVAIALHGLTGDENAMGIFAPRIPVEFTVLFPRAPYPYRMGGYSWVDNGFGNWPDIRAFDTSITSLNALLERAHNSIPFDPSKRHLVGFSQGAALAYAFALKYPENIQSVAGLSGFLPEGVNGSGNQTGLAGIPFFIAHGTEDPLVPISRAQSAVRTLASFGARVTYCEDTAGHKLSPNCFRALGRFYKGL